MTDATPANAATILALVRASLDAGADFRFESGVLMIPVKDLAGVLSAVEEGCVVFGFDSFTFESGRVSPRLDFLSDFADGVSVREALESISGWPDHLWVEPVIDVDG